MDGNEHEEQNVENVNKPEKTNDEYEELADELKQPDELLTREMPEDNVLEEIFISDDDEDYTLQKSKDLIRVDRATNIFYMCSRLGRKLCAAPNQVTDLKNGALRFGSLHTVIW